MKSRCYLTTRKDYPNYGGRGITVCEWWRDSFVNFLADMGLKPSPAHMLDRVDNERPYEPGNCEWRTRKEQNRNRRNNANVAWDGRAQCRAAWAAELGISVDLLAWRLKHWPLEKAMTHPVKKHRPYKPRAV